MTFDYDHKRQRKAVTSHTLELWLKHLMHHLINFLTSMDSLMDLVSAMTKGAVAIPFTQNTANHQ